MVKYEHVVHFYYMIYVAEKSAKHLESGGSMKSKYRKLINMIFTLTLCLGVGMLGIVTPGEKNTLEGTASSNTKKQKAEEQGSEGEGNTNGNSSLLSPTAIPTPLPTPTPYPAYPLEDKGYPDAISILIDKYYQAKISCDTDKLKSISTHPDAVLDKKDLEILVDGIDEYLNMKCYVKRTYQEDFYIVWVYYDIKFIGLDTYAPSLAKFYIQKNAYGEFKNFDGELDDTMATYIKARNDDTDVIELMKNTEKLADEAKAKDENLRKYWELREQR